MTGEDHEDLAPTQALGLLPHPAAQERGVAVEDPAVAARHLCGGTGLVDEDQLYGLQIELAIEPGPAPPPDVRPLLLAGVRGFF